MQYGGQIGNFHISGGLHIMLSSKDGKNFH